MNGRVSDSSRPPLIFSEHNFPGNISNDGSSNICMLQAKPVLIIRYRTLSLLSRQLKKAFLRIRCGLCALCKAISYQYRCGRNLWVKHRLGELPRAQMCPRQVYREKWMEPIAGKRPITGADCASRSWIIVRAELDGDKQFSISSE